MLVYCLYKYKNIFVDILWLFSYVILVYDVNLIYDWNLGEDFI